MELSWLEREVQLDIVGIRAVRQIAELADCLNGNRCKKKSIGP